MSRQQSGRGAKKAKPAAPAKPAKAPKAAKPSRGASAAAARPRGVYVQSPKSDVYVILLGVSLGAIVLACLFLVLTWSKYEFKTKPTASIAPPHVGTLA